ncbi:FAS1 domain-containing isoform A [Chlorella sorokiniana]|uniref:FAS1 domain-containing isoform A n=1 Tax=Chlorella sorokiniana TaxID=3076 RepID=A0A2P6U3E1_CHLSO|nr:FAS1 domain-containing isoform A [Chlorella sorokiniana]|eukprot:PRW60830.1 FAS1 domain-containing isoform A [Chlorella sorokiniana]
MDWATATNHSRTVELASVLAPELAEAWDDPAYAATLFAISDRTWDIMGKNDGLGDYEGILTAVLNSTAYAAGFRKILLYNVHPGEALTYFQLQERAQQGQDLTTALEGQVIGMQLGEDVSAATGVGTLTLIPAAQEIGNATVIFGPDVLAGNASVIAVDKVLLPSLFA